MCTVQTTSSGAIGSELVRATSPSPDQVDAHELNWTNQLSGDETKSAVAHTERVRTLSATSNGLNDTLNTDAAPDAATADTDADAVMKNGATSGINSHGGKHVDSGGNELSLSCAQQVRIQGESSSSIKLRAISEASEHVMEDARVEMQLQDESSCAHPPHSL